MVVQSGLCRTWSETPQTCFLTTRIIFDLFEKELHTKSVNRITSHDFSPFYFYGMNLFLIGPEETAEKRPARRQSAIKSAKSVSWLSVTNLLTTRYGNTFRMSSTKILLGRKKQQQIFTKISNFWIGQIGSDCRN